MSVNDIKSLVDKVDIDKAIEIVNPLPDKFEIIESLVIIGRDMLYSGEIEKAIILLNNVLTISNELNIVETQAFSQIFLGYGYASKGEINTAFKCLNIGFELSEHLEIKPIIKLLIIFMVISIFYKEI
ncbi:MAG: hypothetical protein ACW967_04745 [Candidatus Hodarchaeales archaeon]|jgi:hypothetical protein